MTISTEIHTNVQITDHRSTTHLAGSGDRAAVSTQHGEIQVECRARLDRLSEPEARSIMQDSKQAEQWCFIVFLCVFSNRKRHWRTHWQKTEARYSAMLASYQNQINMLEAELCQVRASIEQQGRDYALLLDIKSRLEQEICIYRNLLENQDFK